MGNMTLEKFWRSLTGTHAWEAPGTRWLFVDGRLFISSLHLTKRGDGGIWDIFSETPLSTSRGTPIWELRKPSQREEGASASEYDWAIKPVHPYRAAAWAQGKRKGEYRPGAVWVGREDRQEYNEDWDATPITDQLRAKEVVVERKEWTGLSS